MTLIIAVEIIWETYSQQTRMILNTAWIWLSKFCETLKVLKKTVVFVFSVKRKYWLCFGRLHDLLWILNSLLEGKGHKTCTFNSVSEVKVFVIERELGLLPSIVLQCKQKQQFINGFLLFLLSSLQEVISEDMRATLNAFLYRTGEQSKKWVNWGSWCST